MHDINLEVKEGWIRPNPKEDVLSISVLERYGVNGNVSNGFIHGFRIAAQRFAMATTVAHDSHNMLVAGTDQGTMVEAIKMLHSIKGGYVVIADNKIGKVPLPFAGLMSTQSYQTLLHQLKDVVSKAILKLLRLI